MAKVTASQSRKPAGKTGRDSSGELLLEVGVEELPYQFIAPALQWLQHTADQQLTDARLAFTSIRTVGTPRRLALVVEGLAGRQAAAVKETMGPSKAVAFDAAGQPTKAAHGFAAGQGVAVTDLQVRRTPKGDYVFAVKHAEGRPAATVLAELVPQWIAKLSFPKAMKWNEAGVRFARPIRWILALYGGKVLPVDVAGLRATDRTWGHRVIGRGKPIAVRDFASYCAALEKHGVIPDPGRRREVIERQIDELCGQTGFRLNADPELLEQAAFTTEYPFALIGSFKPAYLDVPEEILITSMKEHQGFFSLRHAETRRLVPHFIAIANTKLKDMSLIREGNERVLAARLADAKFFWDEDRKIRLEERAKKLSQVTFHQKLGTMAQKQDRVAALAQIVGETLGLPPHLVQAGRRAAELCKADLLSGVVGEFPSLQGIMGGHYAGHDKEEEAVSTAIREQYLPRGMDGDIPSSRTGQVLSLADRLDSIAAFFQVGIIPSGSEDPFALRRQAAGVVRILIEAGFRLDLGALIERAVRIVRDGGIESVTGTTQDARRVVTEFMFERLRHYGRTLHGLRDDVMQAVLRPATDASCDLVDLLAKMKTLQAVTEQPDFDPLMVGFKRAHRLVEKEQWEHKPVDPSLFREPAESELHKEVEGRRQDLDRAMQGGDYGKALDRLVTLKPAVDAFFAAVLVNAEDASLRSNRLSLLKDVDDLFMRFADFSQIVVQGS